MSNIANVQPPSQEHLLQLASQLDPSQLDQFARRVHELAAVRNAALSSLGEMELLQVVNRAKPPRLRRRYRELLRKRDADALDPMEREELYRLTAEDEAFDVERLRALTRLARIRGTTLTALMRDLGIAPLRVG